LGWPFVPAITKAAASGSATAPAKGIAGCGAHWPNRAWGASHKKDCYLAAFFYRQAAKQGVRKAIVSLAHRILVIAFCLLRDGAEYQELGGDFFDQLNPVRTRNRLIRRLQRLGVAVTLAPRPDLPPIPQPT
jgi:transposase